MTELAKSYMRFRIDQALWKNGQKTIWVSGPLPSYGSTDEQINAFFIAKRTLK